MVIQILRVVSLGMGLVACSTLYSPDVVEHDVKDGTYTLSLFTGSEGANLYKKNFEAKAREICKTGFRILEQSYAPSTVYKGRHDQWRYNWVIKCVPNES